MKVINAKNWNLTPAADGRRYSKYPAGDVGFLVSADAVFDTLGVADPAYRIKPPGGAWGDWIAGKQHNQAGTVTQIDSTPLAGPFVFLETQGVALDSIIESDAVVITSEGHEFQMRRRSAVGDYSAARSLDAIINGVSSRWLVWTQAQEITEPPPENYAPDPSPVPGGKEYIIQNSQTYFDASSLNPGDIISINGGIRDPLQIRYAAGSDSNRILIRNNPASSSRVTFRRGSASSGGFIFWLRDCQNVIVDGLFKWVGAPSGLTYGLYITRTVVNDFPTTFLHLFGTYTKTAIRGVEIDGKDPGGASPPLGTTTGGWGIGIQTQDASILASAFPWRENMLIEYCRIVDTHSEGMYLGPNFFPSAPQTPLRNWVVRNNYVNTTGKENIQIKSLMGGTNNRIHDNVCINPGLQGFDYQYGACISAYEGNANLHIYNNRCHNAAMEGIQVYIHNHNGNFDPGGTGRIHDCYIYNNVITESGWNSTTNRGWGISVGSGQDGLKPRPQIYHNTIMNWKNQGINCNTRVLSGVIQYNIVAGASSYIGGPVTSQNNFTGTVANAKFADSDYRIAADSPARDADVSPAAPFATTDKDFRSRPQGSGYCRGAYEYVGV